MVKGQRPLIRADRNLLGGLLYYQISDMELRDASVVIPNGFKENRGVEVAGQIPVAVGEDFEKLATFDAGGSISILADPSSTIVAPDEFPDLGTGDPYANLGAEYDSYEYYDEETGEYILDSWETAIDPQDQEE